MPQWDLGRGTVAPSQYGGLGHCTQKILKFNSANLFIFFHDFKTEIALPSVVFHSFTAYICSYHLRQKSPLHLLLHITHSSKVNCTLDKDNCTLCVRKHTILGPAISAAFVDRGRRTTKRHASVNLVYDLDVTPKTTEQNLIVSIRY